MKSMINFEHVFVYINIFHSIALESTPQVSFTYELIIVTQLVRKFGAVKQNTYIHSGFRNPCKYFVSRKK